MGKLQLKICGMLYPENIQEVAALQPDYMGFIFYKATKRYAGNLDAEVVKALPLTIKRVGVFVNDTIETVQEIVKHYGFDVVQLHGAEDPQYCLALATTLKAENPDFKVMKAFGVDEEFDFSVLDSYQEAVDYFLFDTKTPIHGGSGEKFNWNLLDKYKLDHPYFLSGGIELESADTILSNNDPRLFAIDVNSRFELEPGLKNLDKLKEFKNKLS